MGRVDEAMRRAADPAASTPLISTSGVIELPEPEFEQPQTPVSEAETPHEFLPEAAEIMAADATPEPTAIEPIGQASIFEHINSALAAKTVVDHNMNPATREQYRRLAAALHHAQAATGLKVVMIASAAAGEGKTLTAANLALTVSESYQRSVLLIDADLRRPSLHKIFNVEGSPGLSEGLMGPDEPKLPLFQLSPLLTLLPAGRPTSDPMAGLTSDRMKHLIEQGRETFDWVIVDTPPIGLITDANLLAAMVEATVLVIKAGATHFDQVKRAVKAIGEDRLLGVVLNRAQSQPHEYGYKYNYNYTYYGQQTRPAK